MKYSILLCLSLFCLPNAFSQECERIVENCKDLLKEDTKGLEFISDGQVYTAFLNRGQEAVFQTTFYGGSTYRIAASAGDEDNFVIYTLKDPQGRTLFTNKDYKNAPFWDFEVNETLPVTIITELDPDLKSVGCAVMLIGFNK